MKNKTLIPIFPVLIFLMLWAPSFSQAGKAYVVNRLSNNVSVIDTETHAVIATIPVDSDPLDVGINPSRSAVYVTNNGSGSMSIIDLTSNTVIQTVGDAYGPMGIAVDPSGSRFFVSDWEGTYGLMYVVDAATYAAIVSFRIGNQPWRVATNADGSRTCVTNYQDNTISIIDTVSKAVIATVPVGSYPISVAVFP